MVRRVAISAKTYDQALGDAVDVIFDYAATELDLEWDELAEKANLSYNTVYRLGMRKTRLPRWQTFWKLATACNLRMAFIDPATRAEVNLGRRKPTLRLHRAA